MITRHSALLALPILGAASRASAQAPKAGPPKRLGFLAVYEEPKVPRSERPFLHGHAQKGWILGNNLLVEPAYADWKRERLSALAEELVRKRVDLIFAAEQGAALAAARATRTIPVVFRNVALPVEQGLIGSFGRPGRNVTGQTTFTGVEVVNKRPEFLREIALAAKRLSWLWSTSLLYPETLSGSRLNIVSKLQSAAKGLGFETRFHAFDAARDVDTVFGDVAAWRAQAIVAGGAAISEARQRVAELALRHRLASAFIDRENVEAGGLLSYGTSGAEFAALELRFVEIVDRILRGARPALPAGAGRRGDPVRPA